MDEKSTKKHDGYYWIKYHDRWIVGEYFSERDFWYQIGDDNPLSYEDIKEFGDKIDIPDKYFVGYTSSEHSGYPCSVCGRLMFQNYKMHLHELPSIFISGCSGHSGIKNDSVRKQ